MDVFIDLCVRDGDSVVELLRSYAAGGNLIDIGELESALEDVGFDDSISTKKVAREILQRTKEFYGETVSFSPNNNKTSKKSKEVRTEACDRIVDAILSIYTHSKGEINLLKKVKDVVEKEYLHEILSKKLREKGDRNGEIKVKEFIKVVVPTLSESLDFSKGDERLLVRPFLTRKGSEVNYETFLAVLEPIFISSPRSSLHSKDDIDQEVEDILDVLSNLRILVEKAKRKGVDFLESFEHFDKDQDGIITADEFRKGLIQVGLYMTEEQTLQVMQLFKSKSFDESSEGESKWENEEIEFVRYFQFLRFIDNDCDSLGGYPDDDLNELYLSDNGKVKVKESMQYMYHDAKTNGPFVAGVTSKNRNKRVEEEKSIQDEKEIGMFVRHSYTSAGYVRQVVSLPKKATNGDIKSRQIKFETHKLIPHKGKRSTENSKKAIFYTGSLGEQKHSDPLIKVEKNKTHHRNEMGSIVKRLGYKADARNDYPKPRGKNAVHFTRNILDVPTRNKKIDQKKRRKRNKDKDKMPNEDLKESKEMDRSRLSRFLVQSTKLRKEYRQLLLSGRFSMKEKCISQEVRETLNSDVLKDAINTLLRLSNLDQDIIENKSQIDDSIVTLYKVGNETDDFQSCSDAVTLIELMLQLAEANMNEGNPSDGLPIGIQAYRIINQIFRFPPNIKASNQTIGSEDHSDINQQIGKIYFEDVASNTQIAEYIWEKVNTLTQSKEFQDEVRAVHFNLGTIRSSNSKEELATKLQEILPENSSWHEMLKLHRENDSLYQNWMIQLESRFSTIQMYALKGVFERAISDNKEGSKLSTLQRLIKADGFLGLFLDTEKLVEELNTVTSMQLNILKRKEAVYVEWEQFMVAVNKCQVLPDNMYLKIYALYVLGLLHLQTSKSKTCINKSQLKKAKSFLESCMFELEDIVSQDESHPVLIDIYLYMSELTELESMVLRTRSEEDANQEADEYLCSRAGRNQVKGMVKRMLETNQKGKLCINSAKFKQEAELEARDAIRMKMKSNHRGRAKSQLKQKNEDAVSKIEKAINAAERCFSHVSLEAAYLYRVKGELLLRTDNSKSNREQACEAMATSLQLYKALLGNGCYSVSEIAEELAKLYEHLGDHRSAALKLELAAKSIEETMANCPKVKVKSKELMRARHLWKRACLAFRGLDPTNFANQAEAASEKYIEITQALHGHDTVETAKAFKLDGECKMENGKEIDSRRSFREAKRILIDISKKTEKPRDRQARKDLLKDIDLLINSTTASLVNIAKSLNEENSMDDLNASWLK